MLFTKIKNKTTYLLEIIAIIIGITISFWVENLRESLHEDEMRKEIILSIYSNSLERINFFQHQINEGENAEEVLVRSKSYLKDGVEITDSIYFKFISSINCIPHSNSPKSGYEKLVNSAINDVIPRNIETLIIRQYQAIDKYESISQPEFFTHHIHSREHLIEKGILPLDRIELHVDRPYGQGRWEEKVTIDDPKTLERFKDELSDPSFQSMINMNIYKVSCGVAMFKEFISGDEMILENIKNYYESTYGESIDYQLPERWQSVAAKKKE